MTTIESVCNEALDAIGYPRHIGNIYDGTKAARIALDNWGQTRNVLLQAQKPTWGRRDATLVLLKSAPGIINGTAVYPGAWNNTYPELPWLYEYTFPTDCLEPLQIKSTPAQLPVWRPRYSPFRRAFDTPSNNFTILTNEPSAILTYIGVVKDPNDWQPDFIALMIAALAKIFQTELGKLMPQPQQRGQQQNASPDNSG